MRTQPRRAPRTDPARYASAVRVVLAKEFPTTFHSLSAAETITTAIERNVQHPSGHLEVIVDDPVSANWRLKADQQDPRRVRLSCYRLNESEADRERGQRINTALAGIEL